jgi:prophage regulatory protein
MTKLIRLPQVLARVPLKTTALYAKIKAKEFPDPVKVGRTSMWLDDEITAWIEKLSAARPTNQPKSS